MENCPFPSFITSIIETGTWNREDIISGCQLSETWGNLREFWPFESNVAQWVNSTQFTQQSLQNIHYYLFRIDMLLCVYCKSLLALFQWAINSSLPNSEHIREHRLHDFVPYTSTNTVWPLTQPIFYIYFYHGCIKILCPNENFFSYVENLLWHQNVFNMWYYLWIGIFKSCKNL